MDKEMDVGMDKGMDTAERANRFSGGLRTRDDLTGTTRPPRGADN